MTSKAEYTDCKNLDPPKKSETKENNQTTQKLTEGKDERGGEYRWPHQNQAKGDGRSWLAQKWALGLSGG